MEPEKEEGGGEETKVSFIATERSSYDYLFVDEETDTLHLLWPVSNGDTIATDNTCQSTAENDRFLGRRPLEGTRVIRDAKSVLEKYISDLKEDLETLSVISKAGSYQKVQIGKKENHLKQAEAYLSLFRSLVDEGKVDGYKGKYPTRVLEQLDELDKSNNFAMLLSPVSEDPSLSGVKNYVFSLGRERTPPPALRER